MEAALLIARLLLAAVFLVAGLAKLADRAGSREAIVGFGVPGRLAAPFALVLPLVELGVAAALVPTATAWWGAVGALALLLVFIAAIAVNLARGRKPDCRCFGQLSSSPVGWRTLARNSALALLAGFLVWRGRDDPGRSAVAWVGDLTAAELVAVLAAAAGLGVLAVLGWLVLNLLRQQGRLLVRLEALEARLGGELPSGAQAAPVAAPEPGLPVGSPAPGFRLSGLHGETLTLEALRAPGRPVLLVFTDPHCGPCNALLPDLGAWQRTHAAELTIAVMTRGTPEENRPKAGEHGLWNVLLQGDREVAEVYQENGTPCAVVVRPDGTIGSPLAAGARAIQGLVERTVEAPATPAPPSSSGAVPFVAQARGNGSARTSAPAIGDPAPSLRLPDVGGRTINLSGYRGRKTLVLFWNSGCGFCRQMLDDLRAWDASPPEGAPKLLVVATGNEDDLRAMNLRAPVLVDQSFSVARSFGAGGTPMAVLVDAEGRIASEVAGGAPAVLALARGEAAPPPETAAVRAPVAVGEPAPPVRLPDLAGSVVDLADFRGSDTLVLFWNPGCGFCQQMLDDLRAWEASPPPSAPRLLVISTGGAEENRALGLRSPVVLDQGFGVGGAFGANGTPMAVLVDAEGRIASEVAVGAPAVLRLARGENRAASATT